MPCASQVRSFAAALPVVLALAVRAATPPDGYPASADVLSALEASLPLTHPYLVAGGASGFRDLLGPDATGALAVLRDGVTDRAGELLGVAPCSRTVVGRRMSTEGGSRCHILAAAYLATGESKYADRCIEEMIAISEYRDWLPSHFLGTATLGLGVSFGYDACYDAMTQAQREAVSDALFVKCISAAKGQSFWNDESNWSQVCGCGVAAAALAIARDPGRLESSAATVADCCRAAKVGARAYAPDGVYPEGAAYWGYGTEYYVLMMHLLETACGTEFGLYSMDGVSKTADFIDAITAPSGQYFDFSDRNGSADGFGRSTEWCMFWLGEKAGRPDWYAYEAKLLADTGYAKLATAAWPLVYASWLRPADGVERRPSNGAFEFRHSSQPVALLCDGARWAAIKGGKASNSHGHMDAGSFVYETVDDAGKAVRWVCDGGTEEYNTLETAGVDIWNTSQSSDRWKVFRYGERAHSVYTIDGAAPGVNALVRLTKIGDMAFLADTTALYPSAAASSKRTYRFSDGGFTVADSFTRVSDSHTYRWAFPTRAVPSISGDAVVLESGSRRMVVSPSRHGAWSVESSPSGSFPCETPNTGLYRVVFTAALESGEYRFTFAEHASEGSAWDGFPVDGLACGSLFSADGESATGGAWERPLPSLGCDSWIWGSNAFTLASAEYGGVTVDMPVVVPCGGDSESILSSDTSMVRCALAVCRQDGVLKWFGVGSDGWVPLYGAAPCPGARCTIRIETTKAAGCVDVRYSVSEEGGGFARLSDASGRVVFSRPWSAARGVARVEISGSTPFLALRGDKGAGPRIGMAVLVCGR